MAAPCAPQQYVHGLVQKGSVAGRSTSSLGVTLTKRRRELDFETLPVIESMDIFTRFPSRIEEKFKSLAFLTEAYERGRSALMFVFQTKEDDDSWRNDARLRAALNEI